MNNKTAAMIDLSPGEMTPSDRQGDTGMPHGRARWQAPPGRRARAISIRAILTAGVRLNSAAKVAAKIGTTKYIDSSARPPAKPAASADRLHPRGLRPGREQRPAARCSLEPQSELAVQHPRLTPHFFCELDARASWHPVRYERLASQFTQRYSPPVRTLGSDRVKNVIFFGARKWRKGIGTSSSIQEGR